METKHFTFLLLWQLTLKKKTVIIVSKHNAWCKAIIEHNSYCCYVFQLPGKRGDGPKGWAIQAKLNIMIWLGLHKHKKDYLKDAPKGYQTVE